MKKIAAKLSNGILVALAVALVPTTMSVITHRPEVPSELLNK